MTPVDWEIRPKCHFETCFCFLRMVWITRNQMAWRVGIFPMVGFQGYLCIRNTQRNHGRQAGCHGQDITFFGEVTQLIVPDNPKAILPMPTGMSLELKRSLNQSCKSYCAGFWCVFAISNLILWMAPKSWTNFLTITYSQLAIWWPQMVLHRSHMSSVWNSGPQWPQGGHKIIIGSAKCRVCGNCPFGNNPPL